MLVLISCLSVSVLPTLSDSLCCLPRSVMKSVTEHLIITNKNDCITHVVKSKDALTDQPPIINGYCYVILNSLTVGLYTG